MTRARQSIPMPIDYRSRELPTACRKKGPTLQKRRSEACVPEHLTKTAGRVVMCLQIRSQNGHFLGLCDQNCRQSRLCLQIPTSVRSARNHPDLTFLKGQIPEPPHVNPCPQTLSWITCSQRFGRIAAKSAQSPRYQGLTKGKWVSATLPRVCRSASCACFERRWP